MTTEQKIDPVSGNEIPTGASAAEVRDDIDVKLSENEYVIPADVVRFYGVDRFEKMIQKAKEGWKEMEANGRIGGDPVPAEDPEALSPEDQALLEETLGLAKGGLVKPKGYAEGGWQNPPAPDFIQGVPVPGQTNNTGPKGIETKTYYGPDGSTRLIMLVNGQPINAIPEGFTETEPSAEAEQADPEGDNAELRDMAFENTLGKDYTDMTPDDIVADAKQGLATGSMVEKGLGSLLGGSIAGALGAGVGSKAANAWGGIGVQGAMAQMIALEEAGYTDKAKSIQEAIFAESRFKTREEMEQSRAWSRAQEKASNINISGKASTPSVAGGERGSGGMADAMGRGAGDFNGTEASSSPTAGARGVGQEVSTPTASSKSAAQEAVSGSVSQETAEGLSGAQSTNPGGFDNDEGEWGSGPMNKGGLVSRKRKTSPKPKASKRKGLASKK